MRWLLGCLARLYGAEVYLVCELYLSDPPSLAIQKMLNAEPPERFQTFEEALESATRKARNQGKHMAIHQTLAPERLPVWALPLYTPLDTWSKNMWRVTPDGTVNKAPRL
jgi:hypothetical protein